MKVKLLKRKKKKSFLTCFCHFNKTSLPNNKKSLGCKVKECSVVAISPPILARMAKCSHENVKLLKSALWSYDKIKKKTTVERLQSWQQSTGALYQASERQIFQAGGYLKKKEGKKQHISPEMTGFCNTGFPYIIIIGRVILKVFLLWHDSVYC